MQRHNELGALCIESWRDHLSHLRGVPNKSVNSVSHYARFFPASHTFFRLHTLSFWLESSETNGSILFFAYRVVAIAVMSIV